MKKPLLFLFTFFSINSFSQTNYALNFNGTDQYVEIGAPLSNGSSYTKEAWVNIPSSAGTENIISSEYAPFFINAGTLSAGHGGEYFQVSDPGGAFPTDQWVYVAVTYDAASTTMNLYINGVLVNSNNSVPANYSSENTFIGCHHDGVTPFSGSIDEVRIWDIALTQGQIKKNMFKGPSTSSSGLIAYYKFDDGSGSALTNTVSGTDGIIQNSASWVSSPINFGNNGISFDGVDDFVVIPHVVSSDFTIEYWMKTTSAGNGDENTQWYGGNGIVDAEVGGEDYDWGTSLTGNKLAFGIGAPDVTIHSTSDVNTGDWIHVAVSWQESTGEMKLYINGIEEASATGSTFPRVAPPRITLGEIQTDYAYFNGSINELRLWNEVRSQGQIQANMNKEIDASVETDLLAYYTFNQGTADGTNTELLTLVDMKGDNNGMLYNFDLTGTSSNYTEQNTSLATLPLQWLSFTAQKQGGNVLLNWSTAQEQNTKDLIIQHSTDSRHWNNIATKTAAGNFTGRSDYSYLHTNPAKGNNFYRILQTDIDGKSSYSSIRIASFTTAATSFTVFSNPVTNGTLIIDLSNPSALSLYSSEGKLVWQKQVEAGTATIDVSTYAKGLYFLKSGNGSKSILIQ